MYTFSPEIDLIILLVIMTVGCIIIQSINTNQYLWSQGDCDAQYYAWLNRRITAEEIRTCEIPDLGFSKLHAAIMEPLFESIGVHCKCWKCGKEKESKNFTRPVWQMVNPEDAVCLSCTEPDSHVNKYYEHLDWLD